MSSTQGVALRHNNHSIILLQRMSEIMKQGQLFDVSVTSNGEVIRCHRLILSAFSPHLAQIISNQPTSNLVIDFHDIEFQELEALVHFMYLGEITVSRDRLEAFCSAADKLKIVGLARKIDAIKKGVINLEEAGESRQGPGSPSPKTQQESQNEQQQLNVQNKTKQQAKRQLDSDPSDGNLGRQVERPDINTQKEKRPRVTAASATASNLANVKISPAATVTSQPVYGPVTQLSGASPRVNIPASPNPNDHDVSAATITAQPPSSSTERLEKASLYVRRSGGSFSEACEKFGVSLRDLDAYVKAEYEKRRMRDDLQQPQSDEL